MAGWGLLGGHVLVVREIEVEGGERISAEFVREIIPIQAGEPLWSVDLQRARLSLIAASPWIGDVRFSRIYPDRLKVFPIERRPLAVVEVPRLGAVWIASDGTVLEPARAAELFPLRVRGFALAEPPPSRPRVQNTESLRALRELLGFDGRFVSQFTDVVFQDPEDVVLTSRLGFQALLKNYSVKGDLRLLQRVLDTLDGRQYRYFDLRYSDRELIAKPR